MTFGRRDMRSWKTRDKSKDSKTLLRQKKMRSISISSSPMSESTSTVRQQQTESSFGFIFGLLPRQN